MSAQAQRIATALQVSPDSPEHVKDFIAALVSLQAQSHDFQIVDVKKMADANGILPVSVESFRSIKDKGMGGIISFPRDQKARAVLFGTAEHISETNIVLPELLEQTAKGWISEGANIWYGAWDGTVQGVIRTN